MASEELMDKPSLHKLDPESGTSQQFYLTLTEIPGAKSLTGNVDNMSGEESLQTAFLSGYILSSPSHGIPLLGTCFFCKDTSISSLYADASNYSQLSRDVDRWMNGSTGTVTGIIDAGVQISRAPMVQRSIMANTSSISTTGYILAMILPLFTMNVPWTCARNLIFQQTFLTSVEVTLASISHLCSSIRTKVRQIVEWQSRDVFSALMDIILVIYAFGFLILSFYQSTMVV